MAVSMLPAFLIAVVSLAALFFLFRLIDFINNYRKKLERSHRTEQYNLKVRRKRSDASADADAEAEADATRLLPDPEASAFVSYSSSSSSDADVDDLYRTAAHECLVIVLSSPTSVVGVCAFLKDLSVEYFVERLGQCCVQDNREAVEREKREGGRLHQSMATSVSEEHSLRAILAAVRAWAPKWVYAEGVSFLGQDGALIKSLNQQSSRHSKLVKKFERKFEYRTFFQWTDNYKCEEVAQEDFWQSLIILARQLLKEDMSERDESLAWKQFHLEHWERSRIRLTEEHFHQVPHAGRMEKNGNCKGEEKLKGQKEMGMDLVVL